MLTIINFHVFFQIEDCQIEESNPLQPNDDSQLNESTTEANPVVNKKRKMNFCVECQKQVQEFCKHYENVHRNTSEWKKLKELNSIEDKSLRKKLKTEITDILRKKGNAEFSKLHCKEQFLKGENATVVPVKRSNESSNQMNCVQCNHCLGYYKRRKFSQHLHHCKAYSEFIKGKEHNDCDGYTPALKEHSLPVLGSVECASDELMKEVISKMRHRLAKDVAMRDSLIMK